MNTRFFDKVFLETRRRGSQFAMVVFVAFWRTFIERRYVFEPKKAPFPQIARYWPSKWPKEAFFHYKWGVKVPKIDRKHPKYTIKLFPRHQRVIWSNFRFLVHCWLVLSHFLYIFFVVRKKNRWAVNDSSVFSFSVNGVFCVCIKKPHGGIWLSLHLRNLNFQRSSLS